MGLLYERRLFLGFLLRLFGGHALGGVLCREFLHLLAVVLVEGHVVVAYQVVALLATRLGRFAVAPLEPCQHRLADVYPAVVHYVGLHHAVAVGLHYLGEAPAQQVVAHVAQVQGLVGVGRRVFYHHQGRAGVGGLLAVVRVGVDVGEQPCPRRRGHNEVEESLHHVVRRHRPAVVGEVASEVFGSVLRFLLRYLEQREHHEREVALKLALCLLELHHLLRHVLAVECLHAVDDGTAYHRFYLHNPVYLNNTSCHDSACKITKNMANAAPSGALILALTQLSEPQPVSKTGHMTHQNRPPRGAIRAVLDCKTAQPARPSCIKPAQNPCPTATKCLHLQQ